MNKPLPCLHYIETDIGSLEVKDYSPWRDAAVERGFIKIEQRLTAEARMDEVEG